MIQEPETLYKLMSLYMLERVNFPLTNSQLSQFFLDKEYTTYFTLQSVLTDLVESNLITSHQVSNATHYEITDDGKEALDFFSGDISDAAIADMNEYLEANKFSMRSEAGVTAEYYKSESGNYTVHCTAREGKSTILSIDISIPDETAAENMCTNWKNCSQKVYSDILHTLMNSAN
ncbi:MAG: DUF4364 family protein [Eubacteriales bacterium]|nr:DUF4364 family protein [Eubacteriales bacterium]